MKATRQELSDDVVGVYNHGAKALNLRARLVLEGKKLVILNNDGELLSSWPLRDIRDVTPEGVEKSLRLALRGTDERLNVTNTAWQEEIRRLTGRNLHSSGGGSGPIRVLVLVLLAAVALAALFYTQ